MKRASQAADWLSQRSYGAGAGVGVGMGVLAVVVVVVVFLPGMGVK